MAQCAYLELNGMQMMDVLRTAITARLAVNDGGQPYVVPIHCQLEMRGMQPVFHLVMPSHGRKADALRRDPRVCLAFEREDCTGVDSVLATGTAEIESPAPELLHVTVPADILTGRRYFRHA